MVPTEQILLVTGAVVAPALKQLLQLPDANILIEPRAASTAPALVWATHEAWRRDPEAEVISLHADWVIREESIFRSAATTALRTASTHRRLVTVGIVPTRPETGYGYIVPGKPLGKPPGKRARTIAKFVEKPTLVRAKALLKQRAVWNTGMFAWTASRFRAEVAAHTPEIAGAMALFDAGDAERAFAALKPVSIDVGVYERTSRGAVISAAFGWDDIGSWAALRRVRPKDKHGNVTVGGAEVVDSANCVAWSEDGTVVIFGMTDAVVVKTRGITLVTNAARAPELKKLLDRLPPDLAGERGA
jgi:mannose-1-phosphate guanylyltransferase